MKVRDSGMPEESMWTDFFDPQLILQLIDITSEIYTIADLGCGFGTISIPAATLSKERFWPMTLTKR